MYEPTEVQLPLRELGLGREEKDSEWHLGEVECGEDSLWLDLTDMDPPPEVD